MGNEGGEYMQNGATNENWGGTDGMDQLHFGGILDNLGESLGMDLGTGSEEYERIKQWDRMGGMMKIEPITKKQKFQYTTVAYIANGLPEPQIQRVPISGAKITPHQISFDFFDTSEGKIGVSNASEKHMVLECDILVTDLIYFMWNHAGSSNAGHLAGFDGTGGFGAYTGMRFINEQQRAVESMIEAMANCDGKSAYDEGVFNKNGEGLMNWITSNLNPWNRRVNDFQETQAFIDFRNSFLQQFNGWICKFTSEVFGVFDGVITDISYEIEDGFLDAKWHLKVQEAIFTEDYSEDGKKPSNTSEGSETDSGPIQVRETTQDLT